MFINIKDLSDNIRDIYQICAIMLYTLREGFERIGFRAYLMPGSRHFREEPCRAIDTIFAHIGMFRSRADRTPLIRQHIKTFNLVTKSLIVASEW